MMCDVVCRWFTIKSIRFDSFDGCLRVVVFVDVSRSAEARLLTDSSILILTLMSLLMHDLSDSLQNDDANNTPYPGPSSQRFHPEMH
jgi:hypothetical protein